MTYVYKEGCGTVRTDNPEHFDGWEILSDKEGKARFLRECEAELILLLADDPTVYTVIRHVSSSGMSRSIDLFVFRDNKPVSLTWLCQNVMGWKFDRKNGGIKVSGCGMDMGFHLVNNLSMRLYCPDKYDHDAAYRLKHRWL